MSRVVFDGFRKRDGMIVPFRPEKIETAIRRAAEAVARQDGRDPEPGLAARVAGRVLTEMDNPLCEYYVHPDAEGKRIPRIEDVQDLVEIVLSEEKLPTVVTAYKRYRKQRELARRRIQVRTQNAGKLDVTDASLLLVHSLERNETTPWDRHRITQQLLKETDLSAEVASAVAKAVENQVIAGDLQSLDTSLIRAMVNNELEVRGHSAQLRDLSIYRVPRNYVEKLMFTKSTENSNIVNNNPEAVNLGLAEYLLKQWALDTIFSPEIKRAHETGAVHLHDLGYPHRVYCSSHSIEYVKKYGLQNLANLNTESKPARSASVLTGHLNTFLASMQANYAGALGIAYINIFYAPYLVGMDARHMKQVAQELIFNGSQNAFSRGGQTLFLDFNVHTGVPSYLKTVPAIGPGGVYTLRRADGSLTPLTEQRRDDTDGAGNPLMNLYCHDADGTERLVLRELYDPKKGLLYDEKVEADLAARGEAIVVYGDYQAEARAFTRALLEVWGEGDRHGRVFEFPKCDFHVSDETFSDPEQYALFQYACELASKNGSTYFIFDRDEVTLSACCRLRTTITDNRMLRHPESMRFCGFQNVTINIPQCAYRAARHGRAGFEGLVEEVDQMMELVAQAHLQKKAKIAEMMKEPGQPLFQIGRNACDGRPYVELEKCTYIIGLIGVNDAIKFLIGKELHEDEAAMDMALRLTAHMYLKAKKLSKKHDLKFTLEESPAESAARRLAKSDLRFFAEEARGVVKGANDNVVYYTNSVHLSADAPVPLVERIRLQARFHSVIESGAITHAFIGEQRPGAEAIASLVHETFHRTQTAQLTISPEFTYCNKCNHNDRGVHKACRRCGSDKVVNETRVVGYFSRIQNWNLSKREGELPARQRGNYAVATAAAQAEPAAAAEPQPAAAC
ncbi:MAG: Ribonucleoside-diphosphate reductase NrdZ [Lentisphaerae bacterium ADurb.BinA184]|nr:MAG: Ribonucleoside-diphosphate reductase NrdZ [Lentisphaerae bacterium ADurb.BinA184]